jgi:hypothetical protein
MLIQNLPSFPGPAELGGNWQDRQFDPNLAFPKTGNVSVLQRPAVNGQTPVPQDFFSPTSKTPGRTLPANLKDVGGLTPTTVPSLKGQVDQLYWRRPLGLATADEGAVKALAQEINSMLKPGGFMEFRVLPSSDATRALEVAKQIPGSRDVQVTQTAIKEFVRLNSGLIGNYKRPAGLSNEQWNVLEAAGPDVLNRYDSLGKGIFNRIVRIYKASE